MSIIVKDGTETIYQSYSCCARGLDILNGAYHILGWVAKDRDEAELPYTMTWVKHHDERGEQLKCPLGLSAVHTTVDCL